MVVDNILKNIQGIDFVYLTADDVVRHNLVQKIVNAYKQYEEDTAKKNMAERSSEKR